MRRFGLLGVLLVAVMSVTLLRPARADDVTVTLDFDHEGTTDATYTIVEGALDDGRSGQGLVDTVYASGPFGEAYFTTLDIDLPEDCTVTGVSFYIRHRKTAGLNIGIGIALDGDAAFAGSRDFTYDTWVSTVFSSDDLSVSGPAAVLRLEAAFADPGNTGSYLALDDIEITCGEGSSGGRTRPLAEGDELSSVGIFDYDYVHSLNSAYDPNNRVFAYSENAGASVAAVAAGTVVAIIPFTPDDCAVFLPVFTFGNGRLCDVVIPGALSENSFNNIYSLQMENISVVVVQDAVDSTISYDYYVYKTTLQVGDEVVAGCIVGQTITLKPLPLGALTLASTILSIGVSGGLGFLSPDTNAGVSFIDMSQDGDFQSLFPSLTEQPNLDDCKAQSLSACVNNNPSLQGFAYYDRESDVSLLENGVGFLMPAFNYVTQDNIMIDPDLDYSLSVQARKRETGDDTDSSRMNLQIGSELESFDVFPSFHNYTFTPSGDDWHTDNLTSIFISNQADSIAPIEIQYICLAPVTASTAPGSCYFANNDFDADGTGWAVSSTTFGSGQAFMRDGATIDQSVTLMPDPDTSHFYTIRAVARLIATGSYTGQIDKSVTLNYQYPALGDVTEVGTIDSALVAAQGKNAVSGLVEFDYPYTLEATLEITADTTSTFTFSVSVDDPDNYIQGIRLDSVCIDPEGDGSFPGQGGGGYTPPFIVGCGVVPTPSENSIGPWIFYHWANLRRFFTCDLMKLLNKWFNLFDSFRTTILKVARWWIALVHYGSNWLTSFLWYLNGSFHNIAMGQVTTITESGGCHDIFCAIVDVTTTLANLLTPIVAALNSVVNVLVGVFIGVVNLFFTLIGGLVAFVVALLIKLMSFIGIAISLITGLVGAYNTSTPMSIPGLPSCAIDPSSSPFCYAVWVADNTIFSGRWNTLFNILLSVLAIHLILYTVREIKHIVLQTWSSS